MEALTSCCPRPRPNGRLDQHLITPTEWQQAWGEEVYRQWSDAEGRPSVVGPAYSLNWGHTPFEAPSPDFIPISAWPALPRVGLSAVWALMVVDRLISPRRWLRDVALHLQPGGLLACSFAYWSAEGEDTALGHEQRERIYNLASWRELVSVDLPQVGFARFGQVDWSWKGAACEDHTIATVVAVRRSA